MNDLKIKMTQYLMPNDEQLTIDGKRYIFAMRNRMVNVPVYLSLNQCKLKCASGRGVKQILMWILEHTYIFSDNVKQQVYKRLESNFEIRENTRVKMNMKT